MYRVSCARYLTVAPEDIALFRFLLEAYDNTGYCTVLERSAAHLKIVHTKDMEHALDRALAEIGRTLVVREVFPK